VPADCRRRSFPSYYVVGFQEGEDLSRAFIRPLHGHEVPGVLKSLYGGTGQQGFEALHRRPPESVRIGPVKDKGGDLYPGAELFRERRVNGCAESRCMG